MNAHGDLSYRFRRKLGDEEIISLRPRSDTRTEISVPHSPIQISFPINSLGNGGNEN